MSNLQEIKAELLKNYKEWNKNGKQFDEWQINLEEYLGQVHSERIIKQREQFKKAYDNLHERQLKNADIILLELMIDITESINSVVNIWIDETSTYFTLEELKNNDKYKKDIIEFGCFAYYESVDDEAEEQYDIIYDIAKGDK